MRSVVNGAVREKRVAAGVRAEGRQRGAYHCAQGTGGTTAESRVGASSCEISDSTLEKSDLDVVLYLKI